MEQKCINLLHDGALIQMVKDSKVGSYKSNPWGFYDMHGNAEWCANWYGSYPTGLIIDPSGPVEGFNVRRGVHG